MGKTRLIALDLDGTLLNSAKALTARTVDALTAASRAGIEIVPATGRFYRGMPEAVRALPFLRYAITINGAEVYDIAAQRSLYAAEIPADDALAVLRYLDTMPVMYDCYIGGWGYITAWMQEHAEDYISYDFSLQMVRELRAPVPELKAYIAENGFSLQKISVFTRDIPFRDRLIPTLAERYPHLVISSSLPNNIEINSAAANKGSALRALAAHLRIEDSETAAFGDGLNDLSMITQAGTGVAMANAHPAILAAADAVTASCDEDGVAVYIEKLLG